MQEGPQGNPSSIASIPDMGDTQTTEAQPQGQISGGQIPLQCTIDNGMVNCNKPISQLTVDEKAQITAQVAAEQHKQNQLSSQQQQLQQQTDSQKQMLGQGVPVEAGVKGDFEKKIEVQNEEVRLGNQILQRLDNDPDLLKNSAFWKATIGEIGDNAGAFPKDSIGAEWASVAEKRAALERDLSDLNKIHAKQNLEQRASVGEHENISIPTSPEGILHSLGRAIHMGQPTGIGDMHMTGGSLRAAIEANNQNQIARSKSEYQATTQGISLKFQ